MRTAFVLCLLLVLNACATAPFDLAGVDTALTPNDALANMNNVRGRRVMWGGMIVNTRNLKDQTEIEVLGYPLSSSGDVQENQKPQRRFLLVKDGYLESADFSRGRFLSAVGVIDGTRSGKVDEASYTYPVLNADQVHLWPTEHAQRNPDVGFHFSIGVLIH